MKLDLYRPAVESKSALPVVIWVHGGGWSKGSKDTGRSCSSDTNDLKQAGNENHGVPWWVMLRNGPYKYIRHLIPGEVEELYNLETDPEELANLAADPAQRARLESLRAAAIPELRRTDAGFS